MVSIAPESGVLIRCRVWGGICLIDISVFPALAKREQEVNEHVPLAAVGRWST